MISFKRLFLLIAILVSISYSAWADEALTTKLLRGYRKALSELASEPADVNILKEKGKLYFFIGEASHDRGSIKKAISVFEDILEKEPDNAEIKVFLGSAYTIKARDFPLRWIANVTPIGFIRIYYVKKGINLMNSAVDIDAMHPVIRMVRAQTFVNLPGAFLQFDNGIKDLDLLVSWVKDPSLNERYSNLLEDKAFTQEVYYRTGEAYLMKGEKGGAVSFFKTASSINPDSPIGRAALRRIEEYNGQVDDYKIQDNREE